MTSTYSKLMLCFTAIIVFSTCNLEKIEEGGPTGLQRFYLEVSESGKRFYASSAVETSDGGYLIAGSLGNEGVLGGDQIHLVKLSKSGAIEFQKTLGNGYANKIISSIDGGFIVVGSSGVLAGSTNAVIMKTDADGDLIDSKNINNNGQGFCRLSDVLRTSDGNYIAVGGLESLPWAIKFNSFLGTIWSKTAPGYYAGFLQGFVLGQDANFTATGYAQVASGEKYRVLHYKFNLSGTELHNSTFGAGTAYDAASDILSLSDGFALTGYSESNAAMGNAVMLAKFGTGFNYVWGKFENLTTNNFSGGRQLIADASGDLFITGQRNGALFIWRSDAAGNTKWIKDYSQGSVGNDILLTSDGGILTVGSKYSGSTGGKMTILKTDKDGNL